MLCFLFWKFWFFEIGYFHVESIRLLFAPPLNKAEYVMTLAPTHSRAAAGREGCSFHPATIP